MAQNYFPNWQELVVYANPGPQPNLLADNEKFRALIAGLEPGQKIPVHPEGAAVYHFLQGSGWMTVDQERLRVQPGATIIAPASAPRGIEAETQLAFLAVRIND